MKNSFPFSQQQASESYNKPYEVNSNPHALRV